MWFSSLCGGGGGEASTMSHQKHDYDPLHIDEERENTGNCVFSSQKLLGKKLNGTHPEGAFVPVKIPASERIVSVFFLPPPGQIACLDKNTDRL